MKASSYVLKIIPVLAGILFCIPHFVHAEFTLAPAVIDVDIAPRDIITETIVLENTGDVPYTLFPFVNNVTSGTEGGVQEFVTPSMSDRTASLASWMELSRMPVELKPHEKREVTLTIRVAPDIKSGEYHAVVAYAPGTTVDDAERLVRARAVPVTFVNASYVEEQDEHMNLAQFRVERFVTSSEIDAAHYRVENTGDTELVPQGDIIVYDQRGEEVASVPVNPQRQSVKPGETTMLNTKLPVDALFGKYKAFLTVRYGSEQASVYDTVYFYALPLKKVAIAFGVFALLSVCIALLIHARYRKRYAQEDEEWEEDEPGNPDAVGVLPLAVRTGSSKSHHRDVVMKRP